VLCHDSDAHQCPDEQLSDHDDRLGELEHQVACQASLITDLTEQLGLVCWELGRVQQLRRADGKVPPFVPFRAVKAAWGAVEFEPRKP
jgi:uncharacterized coiled-coil protein SlyX